MPAVSVVHLVWAPLGMAPLERFLRSYRRHPPGLEHRLVLVFKEFRDETVLVEARRRVGDIPHESVHMPARRLDLAAYRDVAAAFEARNLCFLNSNSELLADGWLRMLIENLSAPQVGLVGATASLESTYTAGAPGLRIARRPRYPPFPNPHVRTNAFAVRRDLMLSLRWPAVRTKGGALALESGRRSITRQVWARGERALVIGRDGVGYDVEDWRGSRTYRAGGQDNLLIADNRTRQFESAEPRFRERLAELAWGAEAAAVEAAARPRDA